MTASQRFCAALGIHPPAPMSGDQAAAYEAWQRDPAAPRILDVPAATQFFHGQTYLMRMLDDAEAGRLELLLPAGVPADAQDRLRLADGDWLALRACRGVRDLPPAADPGLSPFGQVVRAARSLGAPIVTAMPDAYRDLDVTLLPLPPG